MSKYSEDVVYFLVENLYYLVCDEVENNVIRDPATFRVLNELFEKVLGKQINRPH